MRKANISGSKIKAEREKQGLSQMELASALDVDFEVILSRSNISEIETGVRGVKDFELKAIAAALDVSVDTLIGDD
jgi:transcriptional regulator with XRE-family HTH domain